MNRIKELRQTANMKQSELSHLIGVAQNTLSYWENGRYQPDNESLAKIADIFNVSVDYILGRQISDSSLSSVPLLSQSELSLISALRANLGTATEAQTAEFIELFSSLSEEQRKMIIASIKGILNSK